MSRKELPQPESLDQTTPICYRAWSCARDMLQEFDNGNDEPYIRLANQFDEQQRVLSEHLVKQFNRYTSPYHEQYEKGAMFFFKALTVDAKCKKYTVPTITDKHIASVEETQQAANQEGLPCIPINLAKEQEQLHYRLQSMYRSGDVSRDATTFSSFTKGIRDMIHIFRAAETPSLQETA